MHLQLLIKFKPGASKDNQGRALGRAKAKEIKMVWAGSAAGSNGGDLVLVKLTDNESNRAGMKAAAVDINMGECFSAPTSAVHKVTRQQHSGGDEACWDSADCRDVLVYLTNPLLLRGASPYMC
jgi:hypothetical protein